MVFSSKDLDSNRFAVSVVTFSGHVIDYEGDPLIVVPEIDTQSNSTNKAQKSLCFLKVDNLCKLFRS